MAGCCHGGKISVFSSLSNVQLACNENWIAAPHQGKSFAIWERRNLNASPVIFTDHTKCVTALCFGNKIEQILLVTGSEDCVIVWFLENNFSSEGAFCNKTRSITVAKDLGYVQHISFNTLDDLISICVGNEVWIIEIKTCELKTVIDGHHGIVNASKFCPDQYSLLVTISEDRTFKPQNQPLMFSKTMGVALVAPPRKLFPDWTKISPRTTHDWRIKFKRASEINTLPSRCYIPQNNAFGLFGGNTKQVCDVEQKSILYHSPIISAYPFLSLAFHSTQKEVSLGSSDGMVRIFSLEERYKCIRTLDLNKYFARHQQDNEDERESQEEPGLPVVGMFYNCPSKNEKTPANVSDYHASSELLEDADSLICATTGALFVVNLNTCQPIKIIDFREPIPVSIDHQLSEFTQVSFCGSCEFYQHKEKIICVLGSLFETSLHLLHIFLSSRRISAIPDTSTEGCLRNVGSEDLPKDVQLDCPELSVLSKAPLCEHSPLKAELIPKVQEKTPKRNLKKDQMATSRKKGPVENQPVTFKTKIKSSGYTVTPRTKMFSPKLNPVKQSKTAQFPPKPGASKKLSNATTSTPKEYNLPTELKDKLSVCSTSVAISHIKFSGSGKKLACALANHTAHVLDVPQTSKQRAFTGHNGAVQTVDFSHDGQYLLTSSTDNTACLWTTGNSEPILPFKCQNQAATVSSKDNPNFSKGITEALFYYLDKFVLLSSGNSLFMYKYHLDFTKDDLKRYQSKSHYKLVTCLPLEKAQSITSFTCINGFYSCSNRSMEVVDMNVNRSLRTLEDVHTRNVHCVKMNQGSKTFSLPAQSYDLFLTAAIADGVKIWDLRTTRCVRKYEGHANRSHPVGVAWSPCGKYFAVGSEDKSTYIYDVRNSSPCERLSRHTDVVFDVAFHPNTSQLVTATLDGKLYFYSDKT